MSRSAKLVAAIILLLSPLAQADSKLDGVWEGWVVDGKGENPNRGKVHMRLTINGETVKGEQIGGGGGRGQDMGGGTLKFAEGQPAQMDATRTSGGGGGGGGGGRPGRPGRGGGGGANLGIVALEGDTLKWCVSNPGRPRPTEFFSTNGPGQYLMIFKRAETSK